MQDVKLRVSIDARFDWRTPPSSTGDRATREIADVRVKAMASRLELAVEVLIAEMLKMEMENKQ